MQRLLLTALRNAAKAEQNHHLRRSSKVLLSPDVPLTSRNFSAVAAVATPAPSPPPPDSIEVFVDGEAVHVQKGVTVLQACDSAGVEIPRFCYHQRLSIAGNCRMCLVEVEKSPKPVASCAMPAMPGMKIKTNTPLVKKAREGVMEFLLLNHPLDCPICDQGGECDLQDQAMAYGSDRGRFTEYKRSVEDKYLGPLVKTVMTRCIHCTRCVRFAKEIAGVEDLGITGRGRDSEIGTYVERVMISELSGNVIDLCPVGALTSKPYAFTARNWELKSTESIDVTDAIGANIRIDTRGTEVMRVLPRLNEDVNEEWITDKARFSYDGLKRQRLFAPMVRSPLSGKLEISSWPEALMAASKGITDAKGEEMLGVVGKLADAEAIVALKDLMNRLGCNDVQYESEGPSLGADFRADYLLNAGLSGVEDADVALLVGCDPRTEGTLLNVRLRKGVLSGKLRVYSVGPSADLTYKHVHLGNDAKVVVDIAEGRHPLCAVLGSSKRPLIVVGNGALKRGDAPALLAASKSIAKHAGAISDEWNGFNILHLSAARTSALDIGILPKSRASKTKPKLIYLLGADDDSIVNNISGAFVIYQGHHGDKGASIANVVLPGSAYTEKEGTYVNTEGRVQMTRAAAPLVGTARDDWKIIRALSEVVGKKLPYDNLKQIRQRLYQIAPHLLRIDNLESNTSFDSSLPFQEKINPTSFSKNVENFYMTDVIGRASQTMAKCTAAKQKQVHAYLK